MKKKDAATIGTSEKQCAKKIFFNIKKKMLILKHKILQDEMDKRQKRQRR